MMAVGSQPCHILGRSRIQSEENRVTLPVAVRALGIFMGDGSKEIAHWGFDEEDHHILFSNGGRIRNIESVRPIGYTTVGSNRLLPTPKEFFPDYAATQVPSPVKESSRLDYGMVVYVGVVDRLGISEYVCRLIPEDEFDETLLFPETGDESEDEGGLGSWGDYSS